MNRGDIWRVAIPFVPGHGQTGERPALVVQDNSHSQALPTVVVVPFTSSLAAARFPGTLIVQPDGQNGLSLPSVALVFQLRALDQRFFRQQLGQIDPSTLDRIYILLDRLTGR